MDQPKIRSEDHFGGKRRRGDGWLGAEREATNSSSSRQKFKAILSPRTKKKKRRKKNTTIPIMQKAREKEPERQHLKERAIYTHGHWLDRAFDDHKKIKNKKKAEKKKTTT